MTWRTTTMTVGGGSSSSRGRNVDVSASASSQEQQPSWEELIENKISEEQRKNDDIRDDMYGWIPDKERRGLWSIRTTTTTTVTTITTPSAPCVKTTTA